MAQIKRLVKQLFLEIVEEQQFNAEVLAKDYYLTLFLYLMRNIKGIYFKGGTALQKTLLEYSRISEDIDFTLTRDVIEVKREIQELLEAEGFVLTEDKSVNQFTRLIVTYDDELGKGTVFIDLNERGKLLTKPVVQPMSNFYPNIPSFSFPTLSPEEMVAEKVAAAIGRNKPRDHFDIYQLIKRNIPINLNLVKKKCEQSDKEFNIIKMFNRAKKLKKRWDADIEALIKETVSFQEVMRTLADYFDLKGAKEVAKNEKE